MFAKRNRITIYTFALSVVCFFAAASRTWAGSPDEATFDLFALSQMERRAQLADQREQCYMYAEVLHGLTELVGRQIAASQFDEAATTIRQIDVVVTKLQTAEAHNARRLKDVEHLLEHTTRRFKDVVRTVAADDSAVMQKTLHRLDALHAEVLAKVFAR